MISSSNDRSDTAGMKLKISIGSHTFNATLYKHVTATAFKVMLPMTIDMTELNGNEK